MPFEIKHFTPEQLAKLSTLNPSLYNDLGLSDGSTEERDKLDRELLKVQQEMTEVWSNLETAYTENTRLREASEKAKKGDPLFAKGEIAAMLLFFVLLLVLI